MRWARGIVTGRRRREKHVLMNKPARPKCELSRVFFELPRGSFRFTSKPKAKAPLTLGGFEKRPTVRQEQQPHQAAVI